MTGAEVNGWTILRTGWDWDPSVVIGCLFLVVSYLVLVRQRRWPHLLAWMGGVAVLLLALVSPLDPLSDDYLFSAHMLQHLLLILIVPPLLLMGIPRAGMEKALAVEWVGRTEHGLHRPVLLWLLATMTLVAWHFPLLYNAALASEGVHIVMHLMFLVTWTMYWWLVLAPAPEKRLSPGVALIYLFAAGLVNVLLGIFFTFYPPGAYPEYMHPEDVHGWLPVLREQWGLTPALDQQWGGLLMWVPAGLIFLIAMLYSGARWYRGGTPSVPAGSRVAQSGEWASSG
jgi:putative membrane protein